MRLVQLPLLLTGNVRLHLLSRLDLTLWADMAVAALRTVLATRWLPKPRARATASRGMHRRTHGGHRRGRLERQGRRRHQLLHAGGGDRVWHQRRLGNPGRVRRHSRLAAANGGRAECEHLRLLSHLHFALRTEVTIAAIQASLAALRLPMPHTGDALPSAMHQRSQRRWRNLCHLVEPRRQHKPRHCKDLLHLLQLCLLHLLKLCLLVDGGFAGGGCACRPVSGGRAPSGGLLVIIAVEHSIVAAAIADVLFIRIRNDCGAGVHLADIQANILIILVVRDLAGPSTRTRGEEGVSNRMRHLPDGTEMEQWNNLSPCHWTHGEWFGQSSSLN
mmetsp:Transcript_29123/g.61891  ORF Transcript_29123/g.61891 Transcript_29123/m.61891 type:complete len:332 (-) Transcript_29123:12-1007(-)